MSQNRTITAIDIGTDKCVTLIATSELDSSQPRIIGVSAVPSRGMKKSQIIDLEQVFETISESLDGAERMAGLESKSAYVSVSGVHVSSLNSKGVVAVASPDQEITANDVNRVIEAARAISLPSDREIIHVIPKDFKVDSQDGVKDPVGMTGVRLESEAHIITGMTTALKNTEKCIEDVGVHVAGFVFSGLAASEVVLSETEKELGVAVVDIGAGSTSLSVFVDGSLEFSVSLPVGARHITQDIALGCRVSLDTAEKIKVSFSNDNYFTLKPNAGESKEDFNQRKKKNDRLKLSEFQRTETTEILSKKNIVERIMTPRIEEIFSLISDKLKEQNLLDQIPAGLIITGGGAETTGIVEIAKHQLQLPARIGEPLELQGLVHDIHTPSYATAIGLIMYGFKQGGTPDKSFSFGSSFSGLSLGKFFSKITSTIKSLLP